MKFLSWRGRAIRIPCWNRRLQIGVLLLRRIIPTQTVAQISHILFSALSETHCIGNLYPHWVCSAPVQIVTPSDLTQLGPLKISKTTSGRFWSWLSSIKNMDTENHCHSITFQLNLTLKDPSSHPSCSKEVKVWASCRGHASQLIKWGHHDPSWLSSWPIMEASIMACHGGCESVVT